ncbi:MAG: DEAD/DEAH box helicase [Phycisphaerae bacterium]|nr:DEAD/DEAH box helicase [Phycisphaerae bacterium]MDD5381755.1 DEAD/DEAH box helicase [Phycisphaerae bacterium]
MPFNTFGLSDPLVRGILAAGYTAPTEVQSQAIPAAIAGKDIIGCAQTGTGKTAAFVLPILNRLSHEHPLKKRFIRSLILTPTRELAVQIEKSILRYGRFLSLRTLAVYGGVNIKRQFTTLRQGVDIVVATPGRLLDHMRQRTIDLRHIEVLVLDEADRMFDMGFIRDVQKIIAAVPKNRQTMLFSATITPEISSLAAGVQKSPLMIQIGRPRNPIETITQQIYLVEREQKVALLLHLLRDGQLSSVLVFSRTKHGADKIQRHLERDNIVSVAIHSGRNQSQRERAMDGFKGGKFRVMVATDIAARGIDVTGISHVINFDVPAFPEDYIHRIGRTGRAEATGDAITFVSRDEINHLRRIQKFIGRDFTPVECPGFTYAKSLPPKPLLGAHRGKFSSRGGKSRFASHRRPRRRR